MKFLIVVDMQNDFIDGALGTAQAEGILPRVKAKISGFDGRVLFTRDTHGQGYAQTLEGEKLPVPHCIKGSHGWQISEQLEPLRKETPIDKPSFGSVALGQLLKAFNDYQEPIESVTLIGLCTDICVISNAMIIKAFLPETPIIVDAACCAGVTPQSHERALDCMEVCQIDIINR